MATGTYPSHRPPEEATAPVSSGLWAVPSCVSSAVTCPPDRPPRLALSAERTVPEQERWLIRFQEDTLSHTINFTAASLGVVKQKGKQTAPVSVGILNAQTIGFLVHQISAAPRSHICLLSSLLKQAQCLCKVRAVSEVRRCWVKSVESVNSCF